MAGPGLGWLEVKDVKGYREMLGLCPGHWLAEPFAVMGSIREEKALDRQCGNVVFQWLGVG